MVQNIEFFLINNFKKFQKKSITQIYEFIIKKNEINFKFINKLYIFFIKIKIYSELKPYKFISKI